MLTILDRQTYNVIKATLALFVYEFFSMLSWSHIQNGLPTNMSRLDDDIPFVDSVLISGIADTVTLLVPNRRSYAKVV